MDMAAEAAPRRRVANVASPSTPRKGREVIDLTNNEDGDVEVPRAKRRKTETVVSPKKASPKAASPKAASPKKKEPIEKRPRRWRDKAPMSYLERLDRAMNQRMFVLDRQRPDPMREEITMAGTTGNVYVVTIGDIPSCTCPDAAAKGNQCKHIIYSLVRVLKVPTHLRYQLSFLSAELASMFAASPLPADEAVGVDIGNADTEHPSNRKPIAGDCPICFCEMEADGEQDPRGIVWCRAACGNNVHKACFAQWARSSKGSGAGKVRCVYCRQDWEEDDGGGGEVGAWKGTKGDLAALKANAVVGEDGYANVADELGISPERDYSSYHQQWVRRQGMAGYGWRSYR